MSSASLGLIDSHCHLNYDYSPKTAADLVREAEMEGVETLISVGVDRKSHPDVVAISEKFSNVYHTVGLHPHDTIDWDDGFSDFIRQASRHPKCRAVGEIGLDYHYDHSPRDIQIQVFEKQAELALELNQPIVIHSRDAEADLLPRLKAYARRVKAGSPIGAIHCFTGTMGFGKACIDLGFVISFSGILTFKTAEDLRECAKAFPLDRLMVETDSPYLAPIPFRGKKCEPAMVKHTAMKIAELKGVSLQEVANATARNARTLFRI